MNNLNKLLVSLNILILSAFNFQHLLFLNSPNIAVLGAETQTQNFEVSTEIYQLSGTGSHLSTEILSNQILKPSKKGKYRLSHAYQSIDSEMYKYQVYIDKSEVTKLYNLYFKSLSGNQTSIYFYTKDTGTGSNIEEGTSDNCYKPEEVDVLTVNIDTKKCIESEIEEKIKLITVTINKKSYQVNEIIAEDLAELMKAGFNDHVELIINSAYRSYKDQEEISDDMLSVYGIEDIDKFVAKPGHSEHHLGTAIDFTSPEIGQENINTFGDTRAYQWLLENAGKYGFVLSYPKEKVQETGYSYEPWHWRYVGKSHAQIYNEIGNISLNQYLSLVENSEQLY